MLTSEEVFKVTFLKLAAEDGFSIEEAHELVKTALAIKTAGPWDMISDVGGTAAKKLMEYGPMTAATVLAGVPVAGGAALGYTAAQLTGDDEDADELKQREVMEEYRRATDQAVTQRLLRERQRGAGRPTRPLI